MHKLFLSILLALPFSISGMEQQRSISTFHKVAQEAAGGGGAVVGGTAGVALAAKVVPFLALTGCMPGVNVIAMCVGGGAVAGYLVAKNGYNSWVAKK